MRNSTFIAALLFFVLHLYAQQVIAQSTTGDLSGDGQINQVDLQLLVGALGRSHCPYNLVGGCEIDLYDYNQLYGKIGTTITAHLPESTVVSCNPSQKKPIGSVNIGTQNYGLDEGNPERATQLIPQIMQKYDLDILAYQELYTYGPTSGPKALETTLQQLYPGKTLYYASTTAWMGTGLVSKYPIIEKSVGSIEDRHIVHARVRTPYGDLLIFSWHAKRDAGGSTSVACRYNRGAYAYMRTIVKPGDKVVFVGDLNATKERIFGECGGNPTELFLPNCTEANKDTCYQYSDFFAGVNGPKIYSLCSQGNFFNIVDAHILSTGTVIMQ